MSTATKFAWGLWVAFVVALIAATYAGMHPAKGEPIGAMDAVWAASFVGFPTAGAIVVSRLPRRPLGWMLLGAPLVLEIGLLVDELASHFIDDHRSTAAWMIWVGAVSFNLALGVIVAIPLYLPNGNLPSPGWRWVARFVWVYAGLLPLEAAFSPGPFSERPKGLKNPLGIDAVEGFLSTAGTILEPLTVVVVAAGVASLIVRFRRSTGIERQQLKWLALGGATLLVSIAVVMVIMATGLDVSEAAFTLMFVIAFLCLPVSIAVAVMKTRLYDLDVVINRTLVYGALTAILALAYLGIVVVLQQLLGPITADSDVAVAGSTLAVAALFRPLRGRVQGFIDRRFYRRKYDAAETLQTFSSRLRDQVDLESLRGDIVDVVQDTMQPAHASLWLRGAPE